MRRSALAEIPAADEHSAQERRIETPAFGREPERKSGVYTDVFEQSILINYGEARRWNFLASLTVEAAIVSLAVLIPLAYTDHLPDFHWKDVVILPKPAPPPMPAQASRSKSTDSPLAGTVPPRVFHYIRNIGAREPSPVVFTPDAPPSIGPVSGSRSAGSDRILPIQPVLLPPPPTGPLHAATQSAPLRVGGEVQMAKLIRMVRPEYPAIARTARISGAVHLMATIAKDGTIRNLQLVDGHPILARAAIQAVAQWVYKPTLLNGEPVEVIAPIEVNFTLGAGF